MNNKELTQKIKQILLEDNELDVIEHLVDFNKEYKATSFYKRTHMSLFELVKNMKTLNLFNLDKFFKELQTYLNNLDVDNVMNIFDQIGDIFSKENNDILQEVKELQKNFK